MRCIRCLVVGSLFVALAAARGAWGQIVFELPADRLTTSPAAVALTGTFNDWSTTATPMAFDGKVWRATLSLPDGRHFYRLVLLDERGKARLINDPTNPFQLVENYKALWSFVDVRGGARVALTDGLEQFVWKPPSPKIPTPKWVTVAGDFNDGHKNQVPLVRQPDGTWVAYVQIRRPFSYKYAVDGVWTVNGADRDQKIPDNCGGLDLFRPADVVTSPDLVVIDRAVVAGNSHELDLVTSYAMSGDYGQAVALVRKVAKVNAAAEGTTSPFVIEAIALEARIHKRWARLDDAAACWKRLAECGVANATTNRAVTELAAYYLFVKQDGQQGRRWSEIAAARAQTNAERVNAVMRDVIPMFRENRREAALALMDRMIADLPAKATDEKYARALAELWLLKGSAHNWLKQKEEARKAFEKVIEVNPYGGSQNRLARQWLEINGFAPAANTKP